jgi:hypothetical protein
MERFNALGRGAQIMLVGAVLLFISLFLPWQSYTGPFEEEIEALGGDTSFTAWHGFSGWVLGLLTIILLAWLVVRIASVDIPVPVSTAMTAGILGVLIVFFAVIKNLVDDYSAWGSYVGVVLAIVVAYGAFQTIQEAGGMEQLKSEIPSMPAQSETTATAPPAPPAAPPAPSETVPPPPAAESPPMSEPAAPSDPAAPSEAADDDSENRPA